MTDDLREALSSRIVTLQLTRFLRKALGFTLSLAFAMALPAHAADMVDFLGTWEQATTNADAYLDCEGTGKMIAGIGGS
ncbi:hypothetical protein MKK65_18215 [Methylobacterium sp. J-001]|uniref:hypothetical protein n=1 Tax=Methylobacterium sp. J-001 TaxID=2836609 RepID=UPI001FB8CEAF|nr:hypothetical protein [Methylobacterium sp. J-001]MCJ2118477.1 hypothetical protein [Methylobacterium sp. J-001]